MRKKEPESLIRFEVFTLVSDEGMPLNQLENFTPGKSYKIRKESNDPNHSIGMLYTVEDDAGIMREINSCYFTAPTPVLKEEFFNESYINMPKPTVDNSTYFFKDNVLKKKKKSKVKEEPQPKIEIDLEEYLNRIEESCDVYDECRQLAGIAVKKNESSLKAISKAIETLTKTATDIINQLHKLDKEVLILKKTKMRI